MPIRWVTAHLATLPQVQAEMENIQTQAASFPYMDKPGRSRASNSLRARLAGAWKFTSKGQAYDHRGNLMMTSGQDVRRWFRSIGWGT